VGGVCCQAPGGGKKGWGKIRGQEAADAQTSFFFSFASFFGSCLVSTCSAVFSFVSVSCAGECQRPYMAALLRVSVGEVKRFDSLLRTFVRSFLLFIWYTFFLMKSYLVYSPTDLRSRTGKISSKPCSHARYVMDAFNPTENQPSY
jgi:hypothetical protein